MKDRNRSSDRSCIVGQLEISHQSPFGVLGGLKYDQTKICWMFVGFLKTTASSLYCCRWCISDAVSITFLYFPTM